jgi:ribosomal protein S7
MVNQPKTKRERYLDRLVNRAVRTWRAGKKEAAQVVIDHAVELATEWRQALIIERLDLEDECAGESASDCK